MIFQNHTKIMIIENNLGCDEKNAQDARTHTYVFNSTNISLMLLHILKHAIFFTPGCSTLMRLLPRLTVWLSLPIQEEIGVVLHLKLQRIFESCSIWRCDLVSYQGRGPINSLAWCTVELCNETLSWKAIAVSILIATYICAKPKCHGWWIALSIRMKTNSQTWLGWAGLAGMAKAHSDSCLYNLSWCEIKKSDA